MKTLFNMSPATAVGLFRTLDGAGGALDGRSVRAGALTFDAAGVSEIQGVSAVRMVRRINSSPIAVMVIPPGAWRR